MNNLKFVQTFLLALVVSLLFIACGEEVVFEDLSDSEYEALIDVGTTGQSGFLKRRGTAEKTWRKVFKENLSGTFFRKPFYFGFSSTAQLGNIVRKDAQGIHTIYNIQKSEEFTSDELGRLVLEAISKAGPQSYEGIKETKVELGAVADFNLQKLDALSVELKTKILKSKVIDISFDNYSIDELTLGEFRGLVNESGREKFRDELAGGKKYVISKVLKLQGLKMKVDIDTEIGAEAQAALTALAKKDSTSQETLSVKIGYDGKKTIVIENDTEFIPFVQLFKARRIKKSFF